MKKILFTLFSLFITVSTMAQTPIPQGGFDSWATSSQNPYYEPAGGWWTTLNTLSALGAPVTVSRTTDVHSGAYAAKMETNQWGTFLLPGLLVSGKFIMEAPFIKQGQPFTDKPKKFKGWIKFTPVNGDSSAVLAMLTRFNTETGKQDTIGRALQMIKNSIPEYTQFDIDFDYSNTELVPDSILIFLTSSAGGNDSPGQVGSTLFADDISLEYSTGLQELLMPEFSIDIFPSPVTENLSFVFNTTNTEQYLCHIYSIDGRLIQSFTLAGKNHQLDVSKWQQGSYIVQAWRGNGLVSSAKFVVLH